MLGFILSTAIAAFIATLICPLSSLSLSDTWNQKVMRLIWIRWSASCIIIVSSLIWRLFIMQWLDIACMDVVRYNPSIFELIKMDYGM